MESLLRHSRDPRYAFEKVHRDNAQERENLQSIFLELYDHCGPNPYKCTEEDAILTFKKK